MRARSPSKPWSLVAVVLALGSACSPNDEPAVAEAAATQATDPTPQPAPDQPLDPKSDELERRLAVRFGSVGSGLQDDDVGDVRTPLLTRLVFQCSDEVTFAVRIIGDRVEVFPPGITNNYIVMSRVPTESGARYTAPNAELRGNNDLATLQVDTERYVDCVSNPAATAWGTAGPGAGR